MRRDGGHAAPPISICDRLEELPGNRTVPIDRMQAAATSAGFSIQQVAM
jgi:hypothetical protein